MAVCLHCDATHAASDLVRHQRDRALTVHCPDRDAVLTDDRDP